MAPGQAYTRQFLELEHLNKSTFPRPTALLIFLALSVMYFTYCLASFTLPLLCFSNQTTWEVKCKLPVLLSSLVSSRVSSFVGYERGVELGSITPERRLVTSLNCLAFYTKVRDEIESLTVEEAQRHNRSIYKKEYGTGEEAVEVKVKSSIVLLVLSNESIKQNEQNLIGSFESSPCTATTF